MRGKFDLQSIKGAVKYMIYTVSVVTACYGFWGCLFPDLTLVKGTYRFVSEEDYTREEGEADRESTDEGAGGAGMYAEDVSGTGTYSQELYARDKEQLYADILDGKIKVTFRSKLLELFQFRRGQKND